MKTIWNFFCLAVGVCRVKFFPLDIALTPTVWCYFCLIKSHKHPLHTKFCFLSIVNCRWDLDSTFSFITIQMYRNKYKKKTNKVCKKMYSKGGRKKNGRKIGNTFKINDEYSDAIYSNFYSRFFFCCCCCYC